MEKVKQDVVTKVTEQLRNYPNVKFNGLWVNEDGVGTCDWEAPDAENVKKIVEAVGSPYDEIVEVKKVL